MAKSLEFDTYPATQYAFETHMNASKALAEVMGELEPSQSGWLHKHYLYHTAGIELVRKIATAEGFTGEVTQIIDHMVRVDTIEGGQGA